MKLSQLGILVPLIASLSLMAGCPALKSVLGKTVDMMAQNTEAKTGKAASLLQTALEVTEAITPEQEHYLGRRGERHRRQCGSQDFRCWIQSDLADDLVELD